MIDNRAKIKIVHCLMLVLLLTGCLGEITNPKVGDAFDNNYLSDRPTKAYIKPDKDPFYLYQGDYDGGQVYKRNKKWIISTDEVKGGILVKKGLIEKTYNEQEIENIINQIAAYQYQSKNVQLSESKEPKVKSTNSRPSTKEEISKPATKEEISKVLAQTLALMVKYSGANSQPVNGPRYCIEVSPRYDGWEVYNIQQIERGKDYVKFQWNTRYTAPSGSGSSGLDWMFCGKNKSNVHNSSSSSARCYPC